MILWNLDLLIHRPLAFLALLVATAIAVLVAMTVHEASHAFMSDRLGDSTAKRMGRLSLNPLRHLDPLGSIMFFLVGFGWGKPVPINPYLYRRGAKSGMAWTALAGPLSNFVVAAILGILVRVGAIAWHPPWQIVPFYYWNPAWVIADLVGYIIWFNLILGAFNLIPIAPLDGFRIAVGILPRDQAIAYSRTERYGPGLLLVFVLLGYYTGFLGDYLMHAVDLFSRLFVGVRF